MKPLSILLAILPACRFDSDAWGTAVGNPTDLSPLVAEGKDVALTTATVSVAELSLEDVGGTLHREQLDTELDLLEGTELPMAVGVWVGLTLYFDSPLSLSGATEEGTPFVLSLPVASVAVMAEAWSTDDGPFLLELGRPGWITDRTALDPDSIDGLVDEIARHSALYRDLDGDGVIGDDERGEGDGEEEG